MKPLLRFLKFWRLLGWLAVGGVIYLSLTPALPDFKLDALSLDKLEHFMAYALLSGWFSQIYPLRFHGFLGLFLAALGAVLEIMQGLTGYRDFEYMDMVANTLGVAGGYLLAHITSAGIALSRLEYYWESYNRLQNRR
ncbi:hypothetical conserved protein [Candidatus Nitrosoglobus terrae]|uniref:Hypothetical conserved protein n=1 Tax=Candidatus Nitrosoglobus terrae TaxID=1630141 RepID=A0A1Q2SKV2_9GAMM|nr:VanZ family protein [Candidatus Nitrosoglobus terrae]BAW79737.1 hypothetical conserved protein [Candidatus Nitrosoglobus terrae]